MARNQRKAVGWFRKAAANGHPEAQYYLGLRLACGIGVPKNSQEALKWFTLATLEEARWHRRDAPGPTEGLPLPWSCYNAELLGFPCLLRDRVTEAIKLFELAAHRGDTDAQFCLGYIYLTGFGVASDDEQALRWLQTAARQSHAEACFFLVYLYSNYSKILKKEIKGVPEADAESEKWFRKAVELNHPEALDHLAGHYYYGEKGVPKSHEEAARCAQMAATLGWGGSQAWLSYLYHSGEGVQRSDRLAAMWCRRAAEQGYAEMQCLLGELYSKGRGVPQDDREAFKWYRRAASHQGNWGKYELAELYFEGRGVSRDLRKAAMWYLAAAEVGYEEARYRLGQVYASGQGAPKDIVYAAAWLSLAPDVPGAPKEKAKLHKQMTAKQRAEARRLASVLDDEDMGRLNKNVYL